MSSFNTVITLLIFVAFSIVQLSDCICVGSHAKLCLLHWVWQLSPCSFSSLLLYSLCPPCLALFSLCVSFCSFPVTFDSLDSLVRPEVLAMADSSIVTLGTARSLLVDSSVYDSRIAETTKDHVFLGMACEDGEGQSAGVNHPTSLNTQNKLLLVFSFFFSKKERKKRKNCRYTICDLHFQFQQYPTVWKKIGMCVCVQAKKPLLKQRLKPYLHGTSITWGPRVICNNHGACLWSPKQLKQKLNIITYMKVGR